jgi:hypothetical protein
VVLIEDVDMRKRYGKSVCESIDRGEGGEEECGEWKDDGSCMGFFVRKRGKRRAPESGARET